MILLLLSLARAEECDPAVVVTQLQASGSREDYVCLIEADAGATLLVTEIAKGGPSERLTRALALWLLRRTDKPMDPALVEALSPGDRRLLADGIRARRGRPSPAPDHVKVFEQFAWYEPVSNYTDARLRPIDRENLAVVDPQVRPEPKPPPGPDEPPALTEAEKKAAEKDVTAETPNLCGCAQPGPNPSWLALGLATIFLRRKR